MALIFAIGIVYLFEVRGIKFYLVPSDSMDPTLKRLDYIIGFEVDPSEIKRGDIIVFASGQRGDFYVKRVIGLPGELLGIINGVVYINGDRLDESYVSNRGTQTLGFIRIPPNRFFLMGDNRTNSSDSRSFGPVSADMADAKVYFIYNPISRMGLVR